MDQSTKNKVNQYLRFALKEIKGIGVDSARARTLTNFYKFHNSAMEDGVLSRKQKELIATGIAMLVCSGECSKYHAAEALRHGATPEELLETMSVAMMMGGGPGVFHAIELLQSLRELGVDVSSLEGETSDGTSGGG